MGEQDGVDDVDGAVGDGDVAADGCGAADGEAVVGDVDGGACGGGDGASVAEGFGVEAVTDDDVVGEDGGQQVGVGEDGAEGVGVDVFERSVEGCEDGEWSVAVEGVDEVGGDDGGDEGGECGIVAGCGAGGVVGHAGEAAFAVFRNSGTTWTKRTKVIILSLGGWCSECGQRQGRKYRGDQ